MSPLAEGADRIVALVAEDLGIELLVPLPMPENLYSRDFESSRSWAEFSRLCHYATACTTIPLTPGSTEESINDYGPERNRQYAEAGAWVAARSDILIAIWDGKTISDLGGTGHVVKFRRDGEMPGYVPHASPTPSRATVFHIVCSRNRADGEPARGLAALQTRWLGDAGMVSDEFPPEWVELLAEPVIHEETAPATASDAPTRKFGYRLPLVIGVTGHRDLKPEEIPEISAHVRNLLNDLQERYPNRKLRLLSPLAEGADRLVANIAVELGLEFSVVLPMPLGIYHTEFSGQESIVVRASQ
jgi:hypothetical protein